VKNTDGPEPGPHNEAGMASNTPFFESMCNVEPPSHMVTANKRQFSLRSGLQLLLFRYRLRRAERAVCGPFNPDASLRIDRALVNLEVLRDEQ